MKVIYSPRNSGRTTELINRSHETGKYILVGSKKEARQVFDFALSLDKSIPYPVTVAEVQGHHHLGKSSLREGVLIDNLEWVLYALLGLEVDTVVVEEVMKEEIGLEIFENGIFMEVEDE